MNNAKSYVRGLAAFILLLLFDQLTKYAAVLCLKDRGSTELIPGVFELYYLENKGAAFGMMRNQQAFFIGAALCIIAMVCYVYYKMPQERRFAPLRFLGILLAAGAAGNMLDRVVHQYVIDFLYFELIDFPVFNVADCYVCVGVVLVVVLLFTYYKDEPFDFLSFSSKKDMA